VATVPVRPGSIPKSVINKNHLEAGRVHRKHAGFAPASQSLLGFRLRSPLLQNTISLQLIFLYHGFEDAYIRPIIIDKERQDVIIG